MSSDKIFYCPKCFNIVEKAKCAVHHIASYQFDYHLEDGAWVSLDGSCYTLLASVQLPFVQCASYQSFEGFIKNEVENLSIAEKYLNKCLDSTKEYETLVNRVIFNHHYGVYVFFDSSYSYTSRHFIYGAMDEQSFVPVEYMPQEYYENPLDVIGHQ